MNRSFPVALLLVLLVAVPPAAHPAPATALVDAARVSFEWGVKIPLRDGVHLNATIYRPRESGGHGRVSSR